MAMEMDAEQVPDLAFIPVGVGPQVTNAGKGGGGCAKGNLDPYLIHARGQGNHMIDDRESRLWLSIAVGAIAFVYGRQVQQHEGCGGRGLQCGENGAKVGRRNPDGSNPVARGLDGQRPVGKPASNLFRKSLCAGGRKKGGHDVRSRRACAGRACPAGGRAFHRAGWAV